MFVQKRNQSYYSINNTEGGNSIVILRCLVLIALYFLGIKKDYKIMSII